MKYVLKIYSIFEFGQRVDKEGRPHQEDCLFPAHGQQTDADRLFILCDGMGGHEGGEIASSTVCEAMSKSVFENVPDPEGDFNDGNLQKALSDALDALDVAGAGRDDGAKKMGTTMTLLKFHNTGCTIAHIGDSRVYHIRPGKEREDTEILFQTTDHSLVNDLVKAGVITAEEAKTSRQKNVITRAMLPNMERRPKADIHHIKDIRKGDFFYMCSDGMLEQMENENLQFIFSEANGDDENKVSVLTQATSQNHDNHSAFVVHVIDVIAPPPVEEQELEMEESTSASEQEVTPPAPKAIKPKPIMAVVDDDDTPVVEEKDLYKEEEKPAYSEDATAPEPEDEETIDEEENASEPEEDQPESKSEEPEEEHPESEPEESEEELLISEEEIKKSDDDTLPPDDDTLQPEDNVLPPVLPRIVEPKKQGKWIPLVGALLVILIALAFFIVFFLKSLR